MPKKPPVWAATLYFAEGLPYSLVRQVSTVFFKDQGASLEAVGLTSLFGLPWVLKPLWAPAVDAFSTRRGWLITAEILLVGAFLTMALGSAALSPLTLMAAVFLLTAFLSATHDIAVDGFYLEALDPKQQAGFVGFQAMAYRLALITGGGGIVWLSGKLGWTVAFCLAASLFAGLVGLHATTLPHPSEPRLPAIRMIERLGRWPVLAATLVATAAVLGIRELAQRGLIAEALLAVAGPTLGPKFQALSLAQWIILGLGSTLLAVPAIMPLLRRRLQASESFWARAFVDYLDRPEIPRILAFLVLYRLGESMLLSMGYPMMASIGMSRSQYGAVYGTFGVAGGILGGLAGGALIARYSLKRTIWPMALAQNVPNLLYAFLAWRFALPEGVETAELAFPTLALITGLVVVESFGAGMGTAAFMVFIMRTTRSAYKAAHMAIATGIMNVTSTGAGVFSGLLATALGFPAFFVLTFVATVPGMLMLPFLPFLDEKRMEPEKLSV